jgi:hypothetical protein
VTLFEHIERGLKELRRERLTQEQREARLAGYLYVHHHAEWDGWQHADQSGDPGFVAELRRAARGVRCFEDHWWALKVRPRGLLVFNRDVTLWVPRRRGAWSPSNPRKRQRVRVSFPCVREAAMPGYVWLASRAGVPGQAPTAKLYLNLKPEGASRWVELLLHDRVLRRVRFQAKLFNHPLAYGRRDTAMMYFDARDLPAVTRVLKRFVAAHPSWVRHELVPFTVALAKGLSVGASLPAEEREGISYGELRSRLVARAVLGAPRERWETLVRRAFKRAGGDFDDPLRLAQPRRRRGRRGSAARRR